MRSLGHARRQLSENGIGFVPQICLFAILAFPAKAADPAALALAREYSHRIWRVQDGLPQNRIQAISQTPDGYLWIGTPEGLVRFDGARFFVFNRSNTPAFHDDSILSLYPSKDGSLWIGAEGGWLLHYRNGAFETFGAGAGLTNGFVRALYEDSRGTLWIGTDRGFFRLRNGKIERLDGTGAIPITAITGIGEDAAGRIWAAGGIGLLVVEGGAVRRVMPEGDALRGVRRLLPDSSGLWLGTANGVRRLENGKIAVEPLLDGYAVASVGKDRSGNLWIGSLGEGLVRLGAGGAVSLRDTDVLPDNTVPAIFEDREQNLWVGTADGLLRLSRTAVRTLSARDGLADDNVSTIYEDRDGALWLATITGKIYRYSRGRLSPFLLPQPHTDARVRIIYRTRDGALWFGAAGAGAIRLADGKATSYTTKDGLRNNSIRQFFEDRRGDLWIALGSGLSRWDGTRFYNYYIEDGLAYGSVRFLMEDRAGDLLVGTDGGLNRIHDGKFVQDVSFRALDREKVWTIHQDSAGALWVGTRGGGLFRIKDGRARRITTRDGLLSNAVFGLLEDGKGNLWMSGPAGVFSASWNELNRIADGGQGTVAVVPYGVADGLESSQMNGGAGPAGCRTGSGELWFPSVKGAVRIDPNQIRTAHPSPVLIESITADDRPIALSGDIRIPAGHGKLAIDYTASSLLSPERMSFRYLLEGFDKDWTAASTHRTAAYTNLPPGRYRFRVVAVDTAAPRSSSEAALSFVWQPHFYQTGWFYGLCFTTVALLAWAAIRIYARQTKARYALLLAERTRLAREMHDTVIQGCVGVSTLLEAASGFQQTNADRMKTLLDQARVQIRLTLDEARQAVWDLRHAQLDGDIAGTLHHFAKQLSAEKGIPIEVELDGAAPRLEEPALRSILLVAREAIRNAANHASPHQIRIRMSFIENEARLEVIDDGRGFTPSPDLLETNGHYGIVGMRERMEQLGGSLRLSSSPGHGTSIVARLPLVARPRES